MKRLAIIFLILLVTFTGIIGFSAEPPVYSKNISNFKTIIIYYGWLNTSNLQELNTDILVTAGGERILPGGPDRGIIDTLLDKGSEVYTYLSDLNGNSPGTSPDSNYTNDKDVGLGSSFRIMVVENSTGSLSDRINNWKQYIESIIDNYVGKVTGVFFDECDPGYFTDNLSSSIIDNFTSALEDLVAYAHSKGLKVFINGVMGYANLGDWYLWEDFLVDYDASTNNYKLLTNFLHEVSYNNSLEWVNGLSRYEYLRNNNLLGKTIAVTFADPRYPETIEWAEAAYLLARIMDLAGWGYANYTYYSMGGPIPYTQIREYETGPGISQPHFTNTTAWRVFPVPGNTTITITQTTTITSLNPGWPFPTQRPNIDGENNNEYINQLTSNIQGDNTILTFTGVNQTPTTTYYYAEWNYTDQESTGGLLHVYIDSDGNSTTGYQIYGIGADYLVEAYTDKTVHILKYTGQGTDWSWQDLGQLQAIIKTVSGNYKIELAMNNIIKINKSKIITATVYNWEDDAITQAKTITRIYLPQPLILENPDPYKNYTGIIENLTINDNETIIISNGTENVVVNYTLTLPYQQIARVLINGTEIQQNQSTPPTYTIRKILGGNYTLINIIAIHQSPLNITIISGQTQPVPETNLYISLIIIIIFFIFLKYYIKQSRIFL